MNEWLTKPCNFIFSKEVGIELVKIAFTALIGFITFKIYQMYRNKKDNSKLYIQMIKLEREITENLQLLEDIIDDHSRFSLLNSTFGIKEQNGIYELFNLVTSLDDYVYFNVTYDEKSEPDAEYIYTERPIQVMERLEYMRHSIELDGEGYLGELKDFDSEINKYNKMSIYNILVQIEELIKNIDIENQEVRKAIAYLFEKLSTYNSTYVEHKKKTLNEFCSQLLHGNNSFAELFVDFKEYVNLSRKLHKEKLFKKTPIKIEFKVWHNQDMDLLIAYNSENYLDLEKFYQEYGDVEICVWELDKVEYLLKEFQEICDNKIIRTKEKLEKILKKTNRLFGKI